MYGWRVRRSSWMDDFERLRRQMDDLLSAASPQRGHWASPPWSETRLFPLLNVRDSGDAFVVTAEIPGMKTEDLEIKIEGDTLTLRGERKPENVEEGTSYHRKERATGAFQRSLTLPGKVAAENVIATYKNGVLTVTMEKEKAAQPRQITVESS